MSRSAALASWANRYSRALPQLREVARCQLRRNWLRWQPLCRAVAVTRRLGGVQPAPRVSWARWHSRGASLTPLSVVGQPGFFFAGGGARTETGSSPNLTKCAVNSSESVSGNGRGIHTYRVAAADRRGMARCGGVVGRRRAAPLGASWPSGQERPAVWDMGHGAVSASCAFTRAGGVMVSPCAAGTVCAVRPNRGQPRCAGAQQARCTSSGGRDVLRH